MKPTRTRAADVARADAVFGALADRTRRDLLRRVIDLGPVTSTELADELPITRQGVAKHLQVLTDAGLVSVERSGREAHYRADTDPLAAATTWLRETDAAWTRRLDRLRRKVDPRPR